MTSDQFYLAQVNVGRILGEDMDDAVMKEFRDNLDPINALAEASPGFVWRLKDDTTNSATEYQPYQDDARILINLSVWTNVDDLKQFVYKSAHTDFVKRRKEWFEPFRKRYTTMWWIPRDGPMPTPADAVAKLAILQEKGPTQEAFTFQKPFPASK
mmetsp:Transcript_55/g.96  ORF Transcript_55/g.96 Transcript_55/m.96 type:complete len:156 (-) Transcript_55:54-521(-)|eukprot:CAMPEP_0168727612 /NCGR_PEP_ID=MMETSP0724-20121128/5265_1 /TAXON_ID=265536 /ORGANISM="Amphiprora sp., Strain CCMP467" /LENGTH=155 /DNA_ID=CAMNT_0008774445 /DNA_START=92 /DNA_END=559 /DNA_ORIENTATION=-